ncbi:maltokinase N-terminal cap-like domain-containing protein [Streptomyces griseosporeus]|uniref:maltokinase N-terminal cap-like domain-containing protein n=1 Tax=Streptomyces griseosporeus TaxID=1910 RepID=UPI0036F7F8F6
MAVIHHTVLKPTKLELLTSWLPTRPWYRGGADRPRLTKAGGFRLDDPAGEVGIEFMVVTDASGPEPDAHLVPLTYRGAPLEGAEHALVGTMEHGVLGRRWAYDGCHDPVLQAQLTALVEGRAQAQAQSVSDTPDRDVLVSYTGAGPLPTGLTVSDDREGTALTAEGVTLLLHRALRPAPESPVTSPEGGVTGHVSGVWRTPDGALARGVFVSVRHSAPDA